VTDLPAPSSSAGGAPVASGPTAAWLAPVLVGMAATMVSQGFARFTYAFVLPAMRDDILGSYGLAGMLGAVNLGAYTIGVLAMTSLARRFEASLLVKVGTAGVTAGLVVMAVAPNAWILVLGMAFAGFAGAAVWIPVSGIVAAHAPASKRGLAYGLMIMGIGVTIALSGVLTGVVQDVRGVHAWREVWWIVSACSFLIFLVVAVGLKPVGRAPNLVIRPLRGLRGEIPTGRLLWCYGLYGVGFSIYVNYLIVALRDLGGLTSSEANRAYALLGVASIFGAVILGRLSDHWHRSRTLALAIAATGACAAFLTVTDNTWQLTGSVVVFGLVMTGIGVVLAAWLSDELSPADVTTAFGAATVSLAAAQFVAPPAGGWLADQTGSFNATFLIAAACSVAGGVVAWSLPSTRRRG
jgi:MFS family permease